jgi:hypothetical protein
MTSSVRAIRRRRYLDPQLRDACKLTLNSNLLDRSIGSDGFVFSPNLFLRREIPDVVGQRSCMDRPIVHAHLRRIIIRPC